MSEIFLVAAAIAAIVILNFAISKAALKTQLIIRVFLLILLLIVIWVFSDYATTKTKIIAAILVTVASIISFIKVKKV